MIYAYFYFLPLFCHPQGSRTPVYIIRAGCGACCYPRGRQHAVKQKKYLIMISCPHRGGEPPCRSAGVGEGAAICTPRCTV